MDSVDSFVLPRPLPVAEDELLDLAGRGLGQLAELDRLGRFEMRDPRADVLDDVLLARLLAGLQAHEGLGDLAPAIVGNRDYSALEHGRVACDRLLHLDGRDVLAARDDDVLLTVAQLD